MNEYFRYDGMHMEDWIITIITGASSALIGVFIAIFSVNLYQKKKDTKEARLSILFALKDTVTKTNEMFLIWFEWWEHYFEGKVIITEVLEELDHKMRRIFFEIKSNWDYFHSFLLIQCSLREEEDKIVQQINSGLEKLKLLIYSSFEEKIGLLDSYKETKGFIQEGLDLFLKKIPKLKVKAINKKKS